MRWFSCPDRTGNFWTGGIPSWGWIVESSKELFEKQMTKPMSTADIGSESHRLATGITCWTRHHDTWILFLLFLRLISLSKLDTSSCHVPFLTSCSTSVSFFLLSCPFTDSERSGPIWVILRIGSYIWTKTSEESQVSASVHNAKSVTCQRYL
jgi:hypothetical protein